MFDQEGFDRVVRDYNRDYMLLLTRASRRHYDCLISSFLVLRDLYNVIQVLYDSGNYTYTVLPYPFSFRADDNLLKQLGFDDEGIKNIYGFLTFVRDTQGMEFEDCLDADPAAMCSRVR
jgi:protein associated with RNAse G/E